MMTRLPMFLAALALVSGGPALADIPATRAVGSARLENVPDIPSSVTRAVEQSQTGRAAQFWDWFPDGSMLIMTRFGNVAQLHRVAMPGGARTQLTFAREPVEAGYAVAGADRFAFVRDIGGTEQFDVLVKSMNGKTMRLSRPGTRNLLTAVSRDRRLLSWSEVARGSASHSIVVGNPTDPASVRTVYTDPGAVLPQTFSPDNKMLIIGQLVSSVERKLLLVDLANGSTRMLAEHAGAMLRDPRFSPDGRTVFYVSNAQGNFSRIVAQDLATGSTRFVTPPLSWDVDIFDVSGDGRTLAYTTNENGYSRLHLIDLAQNAARNFAQVPDGVVQALKFSPDGRALALSISTPTTTGDVWAGDVATGAMTRWTSSEPGDVDVSTFATPRLVSFTSFDKTRISALVYTPKGAGPGHRVPVIIDIHGGPEGQVRPEFSGNVQYLMQQLGAAVITPNVRGSSGYGKKFMSLDNAALRENSVRDIGELLDWIATQPDLDMSRVAVSGGSYGGYMSLASMTHYSNRLVGGVVRYGVSNFISFLEKTADYRRDLRRAEYGDERDPEMRRVFERISPLNNVALITKPMLVLQGANDPRVPQAEADQVVAGLRANGIPAWYVLYADEGHGFRKRPNEDLRRAVETVFFAKLFGIALPKDDAD